MRIIFFFDSSGNDSVRFFRNTATVTDTVVYRKIEQVRETTEPTVVRAKADTRRKR